METYDLLYIWEKLTEKLSHSISESNMDIYIRQITPVSAENDVICCTVPSTTLCSAIQHNYFSLISALLNDITNNSNMRLELKVENQNILEVPKENYKENSLFNNEEDKIKDGGFESNINPNQRFETFVVGNSNLILLLLVISFKRAEIREK